METYIWNNPLFEKFTQEELATLIPFFHEESYDAGNFVIKENQEGQRLFFIVKGKVEVIKKVPETEEEIQLNTIEQDEFFGEMAILKGDSRSASIRTIEPSIFMVINQENLEEVKQKYFSLYTHLIENIAKQLVKRMQYINENTIKNYKKQLEYDKLRLNMGSFFCANVLIGFSHVFFLRIYENFSNNKDTILLTSIMIFVLASVFMVMMKRSGYPMSHYGVTLKNWKKHTWEAILWTIPFLIVLTLIKWVWVKLIHSQQPIFYIDLILQGKYRSGVYTPPLQVFLTSLVYCVFAPVQEFVSRGAIQSSLHYFLVGPKADVWAITITTMIFAINHLHLSVSFALISIIPGIFWGILYAKQRSLVGVSVSHVIIGYWALYVIALQRLV